MSIATRENEFKQAVLNISAPTGVQEDVARLQATEDRELTGVLITTDATTSWEFSFSSVEFTLTAPSGVFDANEARSQIILAGVNTQNISSALPSYYIDAPYAWDDGEELHLHTENNTGSANAVIVVVWYLEV